MNSQEQNSTDRSAAHEDQTPEPEQTEQQGGKINVKSTINEGSTFSFSLSFRKTTSESAAEIELEKFDKEQKNIKGRFLKSCNR